VLQVIRARGGVALANGIGNALLGCVELIQGGLSHGCRGEKCSKTT